MSEFYTALNVLRGDLDNCVYVGYEPDITATLSVTLDGNYSIGNTCPGASQLGKICFVSEFKEYVDGIQSDYEAYKEWQSEQIAELNAVYRPAVGDTFRFPGSTSICTLTAYGETLFLYTVDGSEYGKSIEHTKLINVSTAEGKRNLIYDIIKSSNCRYLDETYEAILEAVGL